MEMGDAGIQWGWIICFCENLAYDNNSGASVRIPGKLCRKISYVAVNYVVLAGALYFGLAAKTRGFDAGQLEYMLRVKF